MAPQQRPVKSNYSMDAMTGPVKVQKTSRITIVGAGVFGLSTADHLRRRGYTSITVLDRSEVLPAPDAASCDINKGK